VVVFPLVAAGVSGAFAFLLFRQWKARRRLSQLAWGVALAQYAVASLAVAYGVTQGWDATLYRTFYLFGAMLNVPWLALGSIALLGRRSVTFVASAAVAVATLWGLIKTFGGEVTERILADGRVVKEVFGGLDIPSGKDVWLADPSIRTLAVIYSVVGYAIVVLIAIYTSSPRKGVAPPAERVRANLLVASGVTIVAVGSTALVRLARGSAFSVTLAAGVAVMFVGFLLAGRAPRQPEPPHAPGASSSS
jgi:hypothetical protein